MARIQFKGKIKHRKNVDGSIAYSYISIPTLDRKHCDMHAFRMHQKYAMLANSDLFGDVLAGVRRTVFNDKSILRLDAIPAGVTVDTSGFLAVVSFEV